MSNIFYLLLIIFSNIILISSSCKENNNNCEKCNPLTNLCRKCLYDNYFPDNNGGCIPKCKLGKNYCNECDIEETLCKSCEFGYYPDEIGGCSFTENCEESYKGLCLKCNKNFILIENEYLKICKSLDSEDLKNCKSINTTNGLCDECEKGYFLNEGDLKCIEMNNCYESVFGVCTTCINGYYLNKIQEKCIKIEKSFFNCIQTLDGKTCDKCNDYYYLAEDGQCVNSLNCLESKNGICIKCNEGYYLTKNNICVNDENCENADIDIGICSLCKKNYYLDYKDRKCKSNIEDNEYKYCLIYNNGCKQCEEGFYPGEDLKCSNTQKCAESDNGICIECSNKYFLGLDNKCTNVEHCAYAGNENSYPCDECEKDYYFNTITNSCLKGEGKFKNCKLALFQGASCAICHEGFYLNKTEDLCYDNSKENEFYKCQKTDIRGKYCDTCEKKYFLGRGDNKCTSIENCKFSENSKKCTECNEFYCLDKKEQKCYDNDFLENTEKLFYIACIKTNEEGTACEECLEGYELNDEGYCVDIKRCIETNEEGECIKCKDDDLEDERYYCANSIYGCVQTFLNHCIKCENLTNLYSCTKCEKGYDINYYGFCT
jgi:hypothetical protein